MGCREGSTCRKPHMSTGGWKRSCGSVAAWRNSMTIRLCVWWLHLQCYRRCLVPKRSYHTLPWASWSFPGSVPAQRSAKNSCLSFLALTGRTQIWYAGINLIFFRKDKALAAQVKPSVKCPPFLPEPNRCVSSTFPSRDLSPEHNPLDTGKNS